MDIETINQVSKLEKSQVNRKKSMSGQYSEFHKLNGSNYVASNKVEDRGSGKVKILEG